MNQLEIRKTRTNTLPKRVKKHWMLYMMLLLPMAYIIIFKYIPMYGVQIAFKDFSIRKGYWGSPFVGLKHFSSFINGYYFWPLIRNTVVISLYSLATGFLFPILLATMLNEVGGQAFKKTVQMVSYLPHFISVVVVVSMVNQIFSHYGMVNNLLIKLGATERISFLSQEGTFLHLYVWSGVWQSMGYDSIIYVAALAGVNPELYEAARIDGANRFHMIIHINIPAILPTMVILFILRMGGIMNVGFEKVFLMQNQMNMNSSRIISTYVYEIGLQGSQYSLSTAVNLFNSFINIILLSITNAISGRVSETSLW